MRVSVNVSMTDCLVSFRSLSAVTAAFSPRPLSAPEGSRFDQLLPVDRAIWFLPYGGSGPLLRALLDAGIGVLP
jgi:hypothetical protein